MTTPHCHHELPGLRVAPASHSCAHKPRPREGDAAARNGEGTGRHSCGESHRCALPGQLPPTRAPRSGFWPVGRTKRVPSGRPSPRTRGGREAADGLCRAFLGWGFSLIHTVYFSDFPNTWPMPRSPWHSGVAGMLPADAGGGRQRLSGPYPHTLPPPRKDPGLGAAEVPSPDPVIQAHVPGQKRGGRNGLRDI